MVDRILVDKIICGDTAVRDEIIERIIKHLNKTRNCHSYIINSEAHTRVYYSWILDCDKRPSLMISPRLDRYDKIDIEFMEFSTGLEISVEPDNILEDESIR